MIAAVVAVGGGAAIPGQTIGIAAALVITIAFEFPLAFGLLIELPRLSGFSLRELGFRRPDARAIGIALLGTLGAWIAATIASGLIAALFHTQHEQEIVRQFEALRNPQRIAFVCLTTVLWAPFVEETLFRIFLFNAVQRYAGFAVGAIVSAALFGLAHGDIANALPLACVGFANAIVYNASRNAFAPMLTHALFNAITLTAVFAFHVK